MPAEWEPHAGTWLSWPHNRATWPRRLDQVEHVFVEMARALASHEAVHVNVQDTTHAAHVRRLLDAAGVNRPAVTLHVLPTDDAWIRDYGAIFVTRERDGRRERATTVWRFDSWGEKYPPWDRDDAAAARMAAHVRAPVFEGGLVLEGGAVETNGAGLLLTTRTCLPSRSSVSIPEIEQRLKDFFGAEHVAWLDGSLAGDDTDGHIDTLARFVAPDHVLAVAERDASGANYAVTRRNLAALRALRLPGGRPLRVTPLPMPAPLVEGGQRLPASYANFYIANGVVLAPVYDDPADAEAVRVLEACFPERRVVPIGCRALVWGLGALHCLTQQIPAADG